MPQIREYTQEVSPAGAIAVQRATPENFGAGVGQAIRQFGGEVKDVGEIAAQREAQQDTSNLDANLAKAHGDLSVELQKQGQAGTLNTETFMQTVSDKMDEVQNGVTTRAGNLLFAQQKARVQAELLQKAAATQATIKADQAKENFQQATTARASAVYSDPQSLQLQLQQNADFIQAQVATGGLPAKDAPQVQKWAENKIAMAHIEGLANINPDTAEAELQSGKLGQYLAGDEQRIFSRIEQIRAVKDRDEARRQKLAQDAASAKQEQFVSQFYGDMHDPNKASPSSDDVLQALRSNVIDSSTAKGLWKELDNENSQKTIRSDPVVFNSLAHRLTLPDGDPAKITDDAELNKHMGIDVSPKDMGTLYGLLGEKHTPQGEADSATKNTYFSTIKNQLIKNPLVPDPKGMAIYQQVEAESYEYAIKAAQQGKSKHQIWAPMLNDKPNPDYVGNHVSVPNRTLDEIIKDTAARMSNQTQEEMIDAQRPDGTAVKLPKSKVDAARKAGAIK